jgi:hypothetical protein
VLEKQKGWGERDGSFTHILRMGVLSCGGKRYVEPPLFYRIL